MRVVAIGGVAVMLLFAVLLGAWLVKRPSGNPVLGLPLASEATLATALTATGYDLTCRREDGSGEGSNILSVVCSEEEAPAPEPGSPSVCLPTLEVSAGRRDQGVDLLDQVALTDLRNVFLKPPDDGACGGSLDRLPVHIYVKGNVLVQANGDESMEGVAEQLLGTGWIDVVDTIGADTAPVNPYPRAEAASNSPCVKAAIAGAASAWAQLGGRTGPFTQTELMAAYNQGQAEIQRSFTLDPSTQAAYNEYFTGAFVEGHGYTDRSVITAVYETCLDGLAAPSSASPTPWTDPTAAVPSEGVPASPSSDALDVELQVPDAIPQTGEGAVTVVVDSRATEEPGSVTVVFLAAGPLGPSDDGSWVPITRATATVDGQAGSVECVEVGDYPPNMQTRCRMTAADGLVPEGESTWTLNVTTSAETLPGEGVDIAGDLFARVEVGEEAVRSYGFQSITWTKP